ncbi:MAG: efflux RND transporter permease subunit [Deltaproteobacteria bacterium]|nr:efflux RND transporter permease subunit [Deltaproteobacteria bacterium]
MTLSDVAIARPVFTLVVQLGILVLGLMSWRSLGTDLFPDVTFPVVTITTIYPGAAPAEIESQITRPMEDAVAGINDLDTVRSFSRESVSVVVVLFKLRANIDRAAQDVRERVGAVRPNLPGDAREPSIRRIDVGAAPILTYVTSGAGLTNDELRRVTEDVVRPQLERVAGVASVEVIGGRDRQIHVAIDRSKLDALNLPLTAVIDKLRYENLSVPAGHFDQGAREVSVRLSGDLRSADEVGNVVITTTPQGSQVRLGDFATVSDGREDARTSIRANGRDAVAFEVIKQSGTNTVQVNDAVKKKLEEIQPLLPKAYKAAPVIEQAMFIKENAHEVEVAIVYGGAMAILVILLFMLDLRSTFISALALPTSVIGTFFVMDMLGFTLNMMTLLAMSLAIGLLIDDAVVVRESIFRHLEAGEDPKVAASKGTSEIALAVLATTLTIVAVFLPVAFMSGVVGQFFKQFGLTISAAVMLSLFVAFTLDPMLSSRLATTIVHGERRNGVVRFFEAVHEATEEAYAAVLRQSVRHPVVTVGLAVAALVGASQLAGLMGTDFVAQEDRAQFVVDVELEPGTSLTESARLTLAAELDILKNKNVLTTYSKIGVNSEINKVQLRVVCNQKNERTQTLWDIQDEVRAIYARHLPKVRFSITPPPFVEGLPAGAPLQIQVRGSDLGLLERDAIAVEKMLKATAGVGDVQVTYSPGKPEQTVRVDRQRAADLGIPVALVARTLRAALEGEDAGKLRLESGSRKEVKIHVRLDDADRMNLDRLMQLQIAVQGKPMHAALLGQNPQTSPLAQGGFVPLSAIATLEPLAGPQVIERQDRSRQIVVTAVPRGRSLGEIVQEVEAKLAKHTFAGDDYFRMDGQVKQMKESAESFGTAALLGVLFIYLILAAQFESFLHPVTIMLSLALALIGAWLALFMTDNSLSMGSNIGIILLMGLVTKNGILLVDAALQLQREGRDSVDAIVQAGRKRLRPILMTSAAMVLGMLPTAVNQGPGSEFRSPMAIVVIGGVITSTVLTLLVLPSVFLWTDWLRRLPGRVLRRGQRLPQTAAHPEGTVVLPAPGAPATADIARAVLAWAIGAAALLLEAWPSSALADVAPAKLTLPAAVARAMDHNSDLKVAHARIREAEAQRAKVVTAFLPDLKAVGTYTRNSDQAKFDFGQLVGGAAQLIGKQVGLDVKIPPGAMGDPVIIQDYNQFAGVVAVDETLFAVAPLLYDKAQEKGIGAQRIGLAAAEREIAYRVSELFYHIAGLDRLLAAARRAVELADQRLALIEKRQAIGTEGELPVLRAQVEKARAEQDVLRARLARRQLLDTIGILTGDAAPEDIEAPPPVALPEGEVEAWIARSLDQRPDLAARRQAVSAQQTLIREAELRWMPILTTSAFLRWSDVKGFVDSHWIWAANVNLVFPLFDRGARYADLKERKAALARVQAEADKAEADLRAQIRQAAHDIAIADDVVRIADRQAEVARRGAEIAKKSQIAGVATHLEVDEALTAVRLAEANAERERANRDLAVLKLRHLTGDVRP